MRVVAESMVRVRGMRGELISYMQREMLRRDLVFWDYAALYLLWWLVVVMEVVICNLDLLREVYHG